MAVEKKQGSECNRKRCGPKNHTRPIPFLPSRRYDSAGDSPLGGFGEEASFFISFFRARAMLRLGLFFLSTCPGFSLSPSCAVYPPVL